MGLFERPTVGQKYEYLNSVGNVIGIVTIVGVHNDDPAEMYYTILMSNGQEKQTVGARLRRKKAEVDPWPKTVNRHVVSTAEKKQSFNAQRELNQNVEFDVHKGGQLYSYHRSQPQSKPNTLNGNADSMHTKRYAAVTPSSMRMSSFEMGDRSRGNDWNFMVTKDSPSVRGCIGANLETGEGKKSTKGYGTGSNPYQTLNDAERMHHGFDYDRGDGSTSRGSIFLKCRRKAFDNGYCCSPS